MTSDAKPDLASLIGTNLPYLRRYARALTGNQETGDRFAAATLEAILEDTAIFDAVESPKVALFHAFHLVWASAGAPLGDPDSRLSQRAQDHMAHLTPNTREALLLNAIEGYSPTGIVASTSRLAASKTVRLSAYWLVTKPRPDAKASA